MVTLDCHFLKSLILTCREGQLSSFLASAYIQHSFIHSFIQLIHSLPKRSALQAWSETLIEQYLSSAYYVLGTVPGTD